MPPHRANAADWLSIRHFFRSIMHNLYRQNLLCVSSDDEDSKDDGMADLQRTLAQVVTTKKEKARQKQLGILEVMPAHPYQVPESSCKAHGHTAYVPCVLCQTDESSCRIWKLCGHCWHSCCSMCVLRCEKMTWTSKSLHGEGCNDAASDLI